MWHSARASTGSERSRLQPPSEVSVASSACRTPSSSKATRHWAWNPCRLPDMVMSWVRLRRSRTGRPVRMAPEGGDRGIPVGLHLLAPEAATHPQALDGDGVAGQPEDVGDDVLRLGRVLGRALDEDLAVLVDQRDRAVRLEVEVLLPGELELAAEDVGRARRTRPRCRRAPCAAGRPGSCRPRWPRAR